MSDAAPGTGDARVDSGAKNGGRQLGVLLVCFDKLKAAGKVRCSLDTHLTSQGDALLDTVVLRVKRETQRCPCMTRAVSYGEP